MCNLHSYGLDFHTPSHMHIYTTLLITQGCLHCSCEPNHCYCYNSPLDTCKF